MSRIRVQLRAALATLALGLSAGAAHAQFDHQAYGTLDLSYGRFQPSGFVKEHRFNSNSLSASFIGYNATYGLDGGWKPGITLETFLRFQDFDYGRNEDDPFLSRNNFVSLDSDYGKLRWGRMQTDLFVATTRFNAFGNSPVFSTSLKQLFLAGRIGGVDGDFYWDRATSYTTPRFELGNQAAYGSLQGNAMHALGRGRARGKYDGASLVYSKGVFSAAIVGQQVKVDNGIDDPTDERAFQAAATYNFGWARLFGQGTHVRDRFNDITSRQFMLGASVPVWEGNVLAQVGYTRAEGPAVDRRQTTTSLGYVYNWDSTLDLYALGQDDRVRNQTRGLSWAIGARYQFDVR